MAIDFYVGEVKSQSAAAKQMANEYIQFCGTLKDSVNAFMNAPLSSKTYDSAKLYFSAVYPSLASGFILACEALIEAHSKFPEEFQSSVDTCDVIEEQLKAEIAQGQALLQNMARTMDKEKEPNQRMEQRYMGVQSSIQKNEEKLQKLYEFNASSPNLFADFEAQLANLDAGLAEVEKGAAWNPTSGTFEVSRMNLAWTKPIGKAWAKRELDKSFRNRKIGWAKSENDNSFDINEIETTLFSFFSPIISPFLGFQYNMDKDYYYTNKHSIQSMGGFMDLFDEFGPYLGMDLDTEVSLFNANGKEYRLQLWKGTYGFGEAYGAEIGLYYKNPESSDLITQIQTAIPDWYACVEEADQLKMKQTVYDVNTKEQLLTNDTRDYAEYGKHFWNLVIKTDSGINKEALMTHSEIEVPDVKMRKAMLEALRKEKDIRNVREKGDVIEFTWKN
ncbi:hypothetical protein A5821_000097 [Enterococcus sp. 7F3_DIV0205]|uniref:LXG domain-containing protein n=1 Tax=Candidatus Enterococcus palustris TaxID=1834189 RepID=A0AAQ3Y4G9_9ENTE|nr:DUF4474 domain-containing protein [Enterococcus sp. 7F3_DIV0205]OTN84503.1 hypothetical protein A5821_000431 [Enterococcus sp. 7F3_DIV0205]